MRIKMENKSYLQDTLEELSGIKSLGLHTYMKIFLLNRDIKMKSKFYNWLPRKNITEYVLIFKLDLW